VKATLVAAKAFDIDLLNAQDADVSTPPDRSIQLPTSALTIKPWLEATHEQGQERFGQWSFIISEQVRPLVEKESTALISELKI
jgi:hypothetical protein